MGLFNVSFLVNTVRYVFLCLCSKVECRLQQGEKQQTDENSFWQMKTDKHLQNVSHSVLKCTCVCVGL